jgi:hypothetical protein
MDFSFTSSPVDLLLISSLATLLVCVAILAFAWKSYQNTRRTLRLSERRAEYLQEERERMALLHEEHRILREALEHGIKKTQPEDGSIEERGQYYQDRAD